ncbi:hypothetical protein D3C77_458590 [compost metagenome]
MQDKTHITQTKRGESTNVNEKENLSASSSCLTAISDAANGLRSEQHYHGCTQYDRK